MKLVTGNTFPVKDRIKAMGGRWNAAQKGWEVPDAQYEAVRVMVDHAPKASRTTTSNYDPQRFNGYGRPKGGFLKKCKTGGNCSSFGDGRSCGGHDCDGY